MQRRRSGGHAHQTPSQDVSGTSPRSSAAIICAAACWLAANFYGLAATYYVDASRNDDSGVGTNWITAKMTIQAAVNLTAAGDTVLVTNGVYNTGTTLTPGYALKNRLVITNAITVRSLNGPEGTIIEGSGTNWYNTSSAVRCVYMSRGTLDGFTLQGGTTLDSSFPGAQDDDFSGGGIRMPEFDSDASAANCVIRGCRASSGGGASAALLSNCTISCNSAVSGGGSCRGTLTDCALLDNAADDGGGGACNGTLNGCSLSGNTAYSGGGATESILSRCSIYGNVAVFAGGGCCYGTLDNCSLSGNSAYSGGGACESGLLNCTFAGNTAWSGGGAFGGALDNCTLTGNFAESAGGGSYDGMLNNCTLAGNSAAIVGGGVFSGTLNNCIVWDNAGQEGAPDNHWSATFYYSCTVPLPSSGVGNIDVAPLLVDELDLRLRAGSPCVDAGDNAYVSQETDLAGAPRIKNGVVDMGAYEGTVEAVAVPVFSPPSGTRFQDALDVTVSCATDGAVIHYTLDGSEPGETNTVCSAPLRLTGSGVVRARAYKDGFVAAQAKAVYTQCVADPVISPAAGTTGTNTLAVTIACATADAVIRYTLDGTEPSEDSPVYADAITLTQSRTVRAKAFKPGLEASRTVAAEFAVIQVLASPVFSPQSGTVATNSLTVTLYCSTPGASIRYTLDGSEPVSTNGFIYWDTFTLSQSATVKARAFHYSMAESEVTAAAYTVLQTVAAPVLLPASGTIFSGLRKVTMSCATAGADIHFTTNGIEPTRSSTRYAGPFNISRTTSFKVKAFKDGMADSPVVTVTYYTLSPLNDALDVTNLVLTTGTWAPWLPQSVTTLDGVDAARSGTINDYGTTWMSAMVTGPGTVSFWWKVSCEDDPDADNWDFLHFDVDSREICRIDGATDWRRVSFAVGSGTHLIGWEYRKDESVSEGEDCGWVDRLAFVPGDSVTTSATPVPHAWLDRYPALFGPPDWSYGRAAQSDADGDGHEAWQEYVAGTEPTNSESVLRALIAISNGAPRLAWSPDLGTARVYTVTGKTNVADTCWGPANAGCRFFRVGVSMP